MRAAVILSKRMKAITGDKNRSVNYIEIHN